MSLDFKLHQDVQGTLETLVSFPSITRSNAEKDIYLSLWKFFKELQKQFPELEVYTEQEEIDWAFHGGIVCRVGNNLNAKTIGFIGHLDVVDIEKWWSTSPFELTPISQNNDYLVGRGSCDMKAWVAIMIELLKQKLIHGWEKNLVCMFTTGEEQWNPNGLTTLIKKWHLEWINFIIDPEPTSGDISVGVAGYWHIEVDLSNTWNTNTLSIAKAIQILDSANHDSSLISDEIESARNLIDVSWISFSNFNWWQEAGNTSAARASYKISIKNTSGQNIGAIRKVVKSFGASMTTVKSPENDFCYKISFLSDTYHNSLPKWKNKSALLKAAESIIFLAEGKIEDQKKLSQSLRNNKMYNGEEIQEALSVYQVKDGKIKINYRPLHPISKEKIEENIASVLDIINKKAIEVVEYTPTHGELVEANNPILQEFQKHITSKVKLTLSPFWTDIAQILGIPSINFSMMETKWAHKTGERVSLEKMKKTLRIFSGFIGIQHTSS